MPSTEPVEGRCGAHCRDGGYCTQWPCHGTERCKMHGGKSPQARRKAEERKQQAKALESVQTYGLPRDIEPHEALIEELRRTAGHVAWLQMFVSNLETIGLTQPDAHGARPSVWVELYERERKHFASVAKDAISAGVEERRVRIEEDNAALVADVLRSIFGDPQLGLTADQSRIWPEVVSKHLRAVS